MLSEYIKDGNALQSGLAEAFRHRVTQSTGTTGDVC